MIEPKWTDEQVEIARDLVEASSSPTRGYAIAAAYLEVTPNAVRCLLQRKRGIRRKNTQLPGKGRIHIVIGDTQVKPGVPTVHLGWIGRYIAEQFVDQDVAIIHLGDHWDMPSLSSYDEGKRAAEGRRYVEDIKSGNEAFALLNEPIEFAMRNSRGWKPERHFLFGNHEDRITRAANDTAALDGALSLNDLDTCSWTRHPFLEPLELDGVAYAHFFYHPNTGKPMGGENILLRLKTIGRSFTMGHQQGRQWAERTVGNRRQCGLVLGSTYLHDEDYRGPQGNTNWRGIAICHQVEAGEYDPMFVSLDYLCRRYERCTAAEFLAANVMNNCSDSSSDSKRPR